MRVCTRCEWHSAEVIVKRMQYEANCCGMGLQTRFATYTVVTGECVFFEEVRSLLCLSPSHLDSFLSSLNKLSLDRQSAFAQTASLSTKAPSKARHTVSRFTHLTLLHTRLTPRVCSSVPPKCLTHTDP